MMDFDDKVIRFTENHEWIRMEDEFTGICGITPFLQNKLSEIQFVDLPEIDIEVRQEEHIVTIDSLSAIHKMQSPVSGFLFEVNNELEESLDSINTDPLGEGWIVKIDVKSMFEFNELMTEKEYQDFIYTI